jgi:hypothetical protein
MPPHTHIEWFTYDLQMLYVAANLDNDICCLFQENLPITNSCHDLRVLLHVKLVVSYFPMSLFFILLEIMKPIYI